MRSQTALPPTAVRHRDLLGRAPFRGAIQWLAVHAGSTLIVLAGLAAGLLWVIGAGMLLLQLTSWWVHLPVSAAPWPMWHR